MTAFRIVDGDNIKVKTVLNEMENLPEIGYKILNKTQVDTQLNIYLENLWILMKNSIFKLIFQLILTAPALMYDSVYAFAKGLQKAIEEGPELKLS
jgi:hypothetical protein